MPSSKAPTEARCMTVGIDPDHRPSVAPKTKKMAVIAARGVTAEGTASGGMGARLIARPARRNARGVNSSLGLDGHGKSLSFLLLGLTVDIATTKPLAAAE